jgi:DNA polymerase III alpha subunit (gram-positive type)
MKTEIYVSTDIETDGPCPGLNSMLSFGSVALLPDGTELVTFTANLYTLAGAVFDPDTRDWWMTQPAAWRACTINQRYANLAMPEYCAWVKALPGKPVFVAHPAGFDWTFMYYYMLRFNGNSPFGFSALDMKTYAMAKLGCTFRKSNKRDWPKEWFDKKTLHTHRALDDAREQGQQFIKMLHYKN